MRRLLNFSENDVEKADHSRDVGDNLVFPTPCRGVISVAADENVHDTRSRPQESLDAWRTNVLRVSMATFQAFRDDRPKEEKWELIDGRPTMMAPPTRMHQRICRNIEALLNARLIIARPEWQADREIGLLIPGDEKYNPEPDVVVADTAIAMGEIYAERFYIVVEVLSPNDKDWVLDHKLGYYQSHAPCRAILFVEQTRIACQVWCRIGGEWSKADVAQSTDHIVLPAIGDIGALADSAKSNFSLALA